MTSFQEAKAHFIASHQNPINQVLHHITNLLAIAAVIFLWFDWRLTVVCVVLTQVFALGGHAFFEKNEPAFKQYPGITILVSMSWSFENWFGLRQIWSYATGKQHSM
ncbi:MAG: DUF962 domain-containing protein [Cyanobacteria bacterium QH_8_48_120]|nr:MAG: DUF962 domain-containing protein [Cyanobacteria bacterium QH_1_48_107]PSO54878.1 MAG: DUF962 domain-containing protein [Cyanobacteria bacterium QH_10_48_56]PSO59428.1 MAG: DUF962 domain-containing protein [Cyanobacteria bacterium QH_7_48_89]PSO63395.1 MAG: DUF962 domain-containing protein [Cyanobacteria bacterium QH_2_48_84]PSO68088.1 MAG: DUF962 domain-containing protein [Cyanobacteria bacterium QH_6_48_35]PSO69510.1 MAG: DUF962 domain-containing protein [Cyanobacteria bacterium QS_1_